MCSKKSDRPLVELKKGTNGKDFVYVNKVVVAGFQKEHYAKLFYDLIIKNPDLIK